MRAGSIGSAFASRSNSAMLEWIISSLALLIGFGALFGLGALIGRECKLYYNSGTFSSPTWIEVTRAIDVDYDMPAEWGNVSSRVSLFKMEAKALIGLILTFGYRYRQGVTDSVFDALRPMALGITKVEFAVADGAIATTGNEYLRATYQIEFGNKQPLVDGVQVDFRCHLCSEEDSGVLREPSYVTV